MVVSCPRVKRTKVVGRYFGVVGCLRNACSGEFPNVPLFSQPSVFWAYGVERPFHSRLHASKLHLRGRRAAKFPVPETQPACKRAVLLLGRDESRYFRRFAAVTFRDCQTETVLRPRYDASYSESQIPTNNGASAVFLHVIYTVYTSL